MKRNKIYLIVNVLVLTIAFLYLAEDYTHMQHTLCKKNFLFFLVFCIAVVLVHIIKALRLYFELYGSGIRLRTFIKSYCKVTPVTMLLPFKCGELFRMYCYGHCIHNQEKGIVVILLDRFMDTAALLTMIGMVLLFSGGKISVLIFALIVFLLLLILAYCSFPGVYDFWKKYLLRSQTSPHTIWGLERLENFNALYVMISNVVKGKGAILFFCSIIAWGIEMGSISVVSGMIVQGELGGIISDYLTAAVTGAESENLKLFILTSVVSQFMLYVVLHIRELLIAIRKRKAK